jgi:hypothetical protein
MPRTQLAPAGRGARLVGRRSAEMPAYDVGAMGTADVIYPVVFVFGAVFLAIGLRNFRRRVLS